jgi:hypothetical protein
LKGLFVVATEGDKPPLPITPGVAYGIDGFCIEFGEVKAWDVDLGEFMNDVDLGEFTIAVEEDDLRDAGVLLDDPNEDH